ncbi:16927_t:CDS:2 [Racocetra fulgida]|uniref:16927_t:CDS:1 n=1 Tax=Racocetra fulgida TaxID=60492 RepID=A0A9N8WB98_9GLOM|nr:16927_t:CDS:2 [Racocetra fulgida]
MGVKGLAPFIRKQCPQYSVKRGLREYYGRVIAIDASFLMCRFVKVMEEKTKQPHMIGLYNFLNEVFEYSIRPLFVFDGNPPQEKGRGDVGLLVKEMRDDWKRFLQDLGLCYVEAPGEAEAQCAILEMRGLVYAVVTDDLDSIALSRHACYLDAITVRV